MAEGSCRWNDWERSKKGKTFLRKEHLSKITFEHNWSDQEEWNFWRSGGKAARQKDDHLLSLRGRGRLGSFKEQKISMPRGGESREENMEPVFRSGRTSEAVLRNADGKPLTWFAFVKPRCDIRWWSALPLHKQGVQQGDHCSRLGRMWWWLQLRWWWDSWWDAVIVSIWRRCVHPRRTVL